MATTTTQLALRKPVGSDQVSVTTDLSDNMQKIDDEFDPTTGHDHSGTTGNGPKVDVTDLDDNAGTSGQVLTSNGAGTAPTFQAAAGGPSQATQAALEAETNEDTYAAPDLIKYSPGVAKAWGSCLANGTLESGSYNITSVTRDSAGVYLWTIATDFSNALYAAVAGMMSGWPASSSRTATVRDSSRVVGTVRVDTNLAAVSTDYDHCLVIFGDQ